MFTLQSKNRDMNFIPKSYVNTVTPTEKCAILFVIAQVEKLMIGQKV